MLFKKRKYLEWDNYGEMVSNIEHWTFISNNFKDYWRNLK